MTATTDVEGAEAAVLRCATAWLEARRVRALRFRPRLRPLDGALARQANVLLVRPDIAPEVRHLVGGGPEKPAR